jgi:hypothetical protein
VEVLEFNSNTVAVTVTKCNIVWSLIGFYGPPTYAKRMKAWVSLHALLETIDGPWLCFGDFNVVIDDLEKEGGKCGGSSMPSFLKNLMFDIGAVDLGFAGNKFTWSNKRWGKDCIRERLDKGIANINWTLCFPRATVYHLGALNSDHCPLLIDTNPNDSFSPRPFHFEAIWAKDPRCYNVIDEAWKNEFYGSDSFILCRKQFSITAALKKWNKETFGLCQTRIKELSTKLEQVQAGSVSEKNSLMEASIQKELNSWLLNNESLWKQKSRQVWLKEGDKNYKFFHLSTIIRRRRNAIDAIKGDDGVWITNKAEIRNHIVSRFQSLYTSEPVSFPPNLDDLILPCITQPENATLCLIPSPLKIKESLFGM